MYADRKSSGPNIWFADAAFGRIAVLMLIEPIYTPRPDHAWLGLKAVVAEAR
jgi:hypothetical protein